jgi:hypothetical protein
MDFTFNPWLNTGSDKGGTAMFANITFHTEDLKWLVPMVAGSIALLGCVVALFLNRSWSLAVVGALAVALIGASVFTKVSLTKEGFTIETAQQSVQALDGLKTVAQQNSDAITQLTSKVNDLTAIVEKIGNTQPAGNSHTDDLKKITEGTQQIQGQIKHNDAVLQNVGKSIETLNKSIF